MPGGGRPKGGGPCMSPPPAGKTFMSDHTKTSRSYDICKKENEICAKTILSHLQYCTLLWANSYYSHLQKLRLLQKKAIRIISNADYLAHSSKLFLNLKLLKLDDIMKFQLGTFMYKLKYNKLPSAIPHMFVTNENIHSHNTRNKNGYLIPNVRTNCRKFTVSYAGPILWNSFPQKLRQLPSEVLFKRKLKYILLATY